MAHRLGLEPEPEWEERVVVVVADIHGQLVDPLEPCPSELAGEAVVAEQDIRHSLAFTSGEPRGHEGIQLGDVLLDHERATGDHDHDALDGSADVLDHRRPGLGQGQVCAVAHRLGVGRLAHDHNCVGEAVGLDVAGIRFLLEDNLCGGINSFLDGLEDRSTCAKFTISLTFFSVRVISAHK